LQVLGKIFIVVAYNKNTYSGCAFQKKFKCSLRYQISDISMIWTIGRIQCIIRLSNTHWCNPTDITHCITGAIREMETRTLALRFQFWFMDMWHDVTKSLLILKKNKVLNHWHLIYWSNKSCNRNSNTKIFG
jgi:hypothetical protein